MSALDTVRDFVAREFLPGTPPQEIDPHLDLMESGIIDSLGILKIVAWLENSCGVAADGLDLDRLTHQLSTVANIAELLADTRVGARVGTGGGTT